MSESLESRNLLESEVCPGALVSPESTRRPQSAVFPEASKPSGPVASFSANLRKLTGISHLAAIDLFDAQVNVVACIENKAGSQESPAICNHLAQTYGAITPEAARKGLELLAEHTADARSHPGKHPNIDRLLMLFREKKILRIKHVFAF